MSDELDLLFTRVRQGTLPHALLFSGPKGAGKRDAALALSAALLTTETPEKHPDLHLYTPDSAGRMHTIEAMRRLIDEVFMAPFSAAAKVFIIEEADRMPPASSNALLKTLEEPARSTYLILLTEKPGSILPTILSRVYNCSFYPSAPAAIGRTPERDQLVELLFAPLPYPLFLKKIVAFDAVESPEGILEEILHWHCDRHLLANGGDPARLRFFAYRKELESCTQPLRPLPALFEQIEQLCFALQQHVKLRHCLDLLLAQPL